MRVDRQVGGTCIHNPNPTPRGVRRVDQTCSQRHNVLHVHQWRHTQSLTCTPVGYSGNMTSSMPHVRSVLLPIPAISYPSRVPTLPHHEIVSKMTARITSRIHCASRHARPAAASSGDWGYRSTRQGARRNRSTRQIRTYQQTSASEENGSVSCQLCSA